MRFDRKLFVLASASCLVLFLAVAAPSCAAGQMTISSVNPGMYITPEMEYTMELQLNGVTLHVPMSWFISNQYSEGAVNRILAAQQHSNIVFFNGAILVPSAGPMVDLSVAAQFIAPLGVGNSTGSESQARIWRFKGYTIGSPHQEIWYIPAHNVIIKVRYETSEEKGLIDQIFDTINLEPDLTPQV